MKEGTFVIISASRRTDIPAFYGDWFMNRIQEGYFLRINPFNRKQQKKISLSPADVDAFVFWSKNPRPFFKYLDVLDSMGYSYLFQFTLNDYPSILEPKLPALSHRIETMQILGEKIGKEKVIWRYDPIIISNITPVSYHIEHFHKLVEALSPWTTRVMISFYDGYGKAERRLKKLEKEKGLVIQNTITSSYLKQLLKEIGKIAKQNHLSIFSCAEEMDLEDFGIHHGACIDISWINKVLNLNLANKKDPHQRKECLCGISIDMGSYDTCLFSCQYCYATTSEKTVLNRRKTFDVNRPWL